MNSWDTRPDRVNTIVYPKHEVKVSSLQTETKLRGESPEIPYMKT
jgi:hypothetical protein